MYNFTANFGYVDISKLSLDMTAYGNINTELLIDINLTDDGKLSIIGKVLNVDTDEFVIYGQIKDDISYKLIEDINYQNAYKKLVRYWKVYHLNYNKLGTLKQIKELNKHFKKSNESDIITIEDNIEYLKSINLYNDNGIIYGEDKITWKLPKTLLAFLNDLFLNYSDGNNDD